MNQTNSAEPAKGGVTVAGPGAAAAPVRCVKCEYDLAGLAEEAMCPECGHAVAHSRKVWAARLPTGRSLVRMRRGLVTAVGGFGLLAGSYVLLWLVGLAWSERSELYWMVDFGPEVSRIGVAVGLLMIARAYKRGARPDNSWRLLMLWGAVANLAAEIPMVGIRLLWNDAGRNGAAFGIAIDWLWLFWAVLAVAICFVWPAMLLASLWLMRRLGKTLGDREIAAVAAGLMVAAVVIETLYSIEYLALILLQPNWNLDFTRFALPPLYFCCTLLTLRAAQQVRAVERTGEPRRIDWIREVRAGLRKLAWKMRIDEQEPPPPGR